MTTLTVPASRTAASNPGRLGMLWNAWRQHRFALIGLMIVSAGLALRLIVTGVPLHAAYSDYLRHHCVTERHAICGSLLTQMNASWVTRYSGMVVLPVLIGVFLGAPLVAREYETGTYRYALTQGISARRQLTSKLLIIGAAVVIGSCLLGLLTMWCLQPFHRIALGYDTGLSYWEPDYFNITAVTLPAWALLDFWLGVLAGVVIKRTVPAMAAVLAGVVTAAVLATGFAVLTSGTLTERLLGVSPVPVRSVPPLSPSGSFVRLSGTGVPVWSGPPGRITEVNDYPAGWAGPHGSWQVSGWFTGPDGQRMTAQAAQSMLNRIPAHIATAPALLRRWLADHHIAYWIGYQPASRYWLFQGAAAAILIAVAAAAGLLAVRLIGKRE